MPYTLLIDPTEACNPYCKECWAGKYQVNTLSVETIDCILNEVKALDIHFIAMSGGEPFTYAPLLDLAARHHDIAIMIHTNGTLNN